MKTTWGSVNGHGVELMKDPVTDRGTKKSAKGLLRVEKVGEDYVLHEQQTREQEQSGELRVMFEDGSIYGTPKVSEIRSLLLSEIKI
jgi:nicotinamide phosphoribosyltransferase